MSVCVLEWGGGGIMIITIAFTLMIDDRLYSTIPRCLERLTALACGSTRVTSFIMRF